MAENEHTAHQAELVASELFSEFFWHRLGPTNHDWPCEDQDVHGVTTHPCDVVYYYDEPYAARQTYVHCDLKSYAKGSITTAAVRSAVESLARQVACAERSDEWRGLHTHDNVTFSVVGLLFVYNHDGEFEADFQKNLVHIAPESLQLPRGSKLFVLGPKEIFWLDNIRAEIQRMRGKARPELPTPEHCFFFHPQLTRRANLQVKTAKAATLETLTSPIIILEHRDPRRSAQRGIVVFYSRPGDTVDEFMYLIDTLRKYELLDGDTSITVKTLHASPVSSPTFQKAQLQYIEGIAGTVAETDLGEYVKAIRYEPMNEIRTSYSNIDLGTWA
ncbi:hypothetical protein NDQ41_05955 [Alcaligenes faecalis]|uniref:hypothetical protein n=1 Tax=Alcaligenes faecalis TaxID=511 RepID=UPI00203D3FA7|nr:hypothetical protein [Alcaligenes faecalis]MCM2558240.1 hypothetical protein [Alcaligenes faecalis]MCM2621776.1 hypothetical protein [Alcaligenes faecalis]